MSDSIIITITKAMESIRQGAKRAEFTSENPPDNKLPIHVIAYRVASVLRVDVQGILD